MTGIVNVLFNVVLMSCGAVVPEATTSVRNDLTDIFVAETREMVDRRSALRTGPSDSEQSRWAAGRLQTGDAWLDYAQSVRVRASDERRNEYIERRRAGDGSARDHLALAAWCKRQRMHDRERTHLLAAIAQDPNAVTKTSLRRLGFAVENGEWRSPEDQVRRERVTTTIEQSLRVWGPKVSRWRNLLESGGPRSRTAADELLAIRDPAAVVAIDLLIGRGSRDRALLAVKALSQIDCYESSLTLAKYACFHDVRSVREAASLALRDRRIDDFVPSLISLMVTEFDVQPFQSGVNPWQMVGGMTDLEVVAGLILKRESFSDIQVATSAVRFQLIPRIVRARARPFFDPVTIRISRFSSQNLLYSTRKSLYRATRQAEILDDEAAAVNERVGAVLATAVGTEPSSDPRHWWAWWYRTMDTAPEEKRVVEIAELTEVEDQQLEVEIMIRGSSCFAAGTPVWTETGLQPIESIQVGDMVLSKDVETGQLAWRPVVRTTVRRQRELVRIETSNDTIDSTPIHRFWHSGHGWTVARDVEADHLIHGVTGSVRVNAVSVSPNADVYNLVVDGFHTYFVGHDGLLVQDLAAPAPTNMAVPALTRWELARHLTAEDNDTDTPDRSLTTTSAGSE